MVLRFFAFYAQGEESFGTDDNQLKNFLNRFMEANKNLGNDDVQYYEDLFVRTFDKIMEFVKNPFKRPNMKNDRKGWEGKSNRGIFDMSMLAFAWELDNISVKKEEFNKQYEELLRVDVNLIGNLSYTNKSSLMSRVSKIRAILKK